MLATCTNSSKEYLKEIQKKQMLNMLTINTRYVSNVSIGFRVRPITPHVRRYKPYTFVKREERHRTKSENNDSNDGVSLIKAVVEDPMIPYNVNERPITTTCNLKKAKSLESIIAENLKCSTNNVNTTYRGVDDVLLDDDDNSSLTCLPELEVVSSCIEKLKVNE